MRSDHAAKVEDAEIVKIYRKEQTIALQFPFPKRQGGGVAEVNISQQRM